MMLERFFPLALIMFSLLSVLSHQARAEYVLDDIVAIVNEDIILRSELDRFHSTLLQTTSNAAIDRRRALDTLIIRKIQLETANRQGIYIDDARVETYIENFLKANQRTRESHSAQLERQGGSYAGWRLEIKEFLLINELQKQQLNAYIRITRDDIDEYLADRPPPFLRQTHYDFIHIVFDETDSADIEEIIDDLADLTRDEILLTKTSLAPREFRDRRLDSLPKVLASQVMFMQEGETISFRQGKDVQHIIKLLDIRYPEQLLQTEYRLQTLSLLPDIVHTDWQLEAEIRELRARLLAGESFEELAATYGSLNAPLSVFDQQWNRAVILPPELRQALAGLQAGELALPFNADGGWHLARLIDRRERDTTLERLREETHGLLAQRKLRLVQEFWLNDIRSQAYIEYRTENDRAIEDKGL